MTAANLMVVQPSFEIKVNAWGVPGTITIDDVIRRCNWYGSAEVDVVLDDTIANGVTLVIVLEMRRYRLQYHGTWRDVSIERDTIRVLGNDLDAVLTKALEWIHLHPEYTSAEPDAVTIKAYHEQEREREFAEWKTKNV